MWIKLDGEPADETNAMSPEETAVMEEAVASQPPPASATGAPWGSFYTAPDGSSPPRTAPAPKKSKSARRRAKTDRRKASERREQGERREDAVDPSSDRREGADRREEPVEAAPAEKPKRRSFALRTGGNRRVEDQRRSFRLRRGRRQEDAPAPAPGEEPLAPVATAAGSRRYAEPHVLVGIVGGTIIALAAILIALLYMIGTSA